MEKIEHINYIKVPVSKVYKTLSTMEGLSETWTNKLTVQPEIGFVNEFYFSDDNPTKMKIIELVENQKISWQCIDSDPEWIGTTITFDLAEKYGVSSVVLRHSDWRELTEFYRWCNYNWAMFLFSLKTYCENGVGLPFQKRIF